MLLLLFLDTFPRYFYYTRLRSYKDILACYQHQFAKYIDHYLTISRQLKTPKMHFCKYFQVAASIEFENGFMCVTQNGECVDLEWRGVFIISPSKNSYFPPSTHTLGIHMNNRKRCQGAIASIS